LDPRQVPHACKVPDSNPHDVCSDRIGHPQYSTYHSSHPKL
jgi:hypothetical protein